MFAGIYALMGLAWGPGWLRASFFPFFLFVFCIPISSIGESVTLPLRNLVARIVEALCNNNFVGMDIHRDGTQLFNSARTFKKLRGCRRLQRHAQPGGGICAGDDLWFHEL